MVMSDRKAPRFGPVRALGTGKLNEGAGQLTVPKRALDALREERPLASRFEIFGDIAQRCLILVEVPDDADDTLLLEARLAANAGHDVSQ
jgi:hypothetical protein